MKTSTKIAKLCQICAQIVLAISCVICFLPTNQLAGQLAPQKTSFLLLKNGGLFRGFISRVENGFEITSTSGSRFRMAEDQVAGQYDTIQQVFGHKFLLAKKKNSFAGYSELVYWCVGEDLFDESRQVITFYSQNGFSSKQYGRQPTKRELDQNQKLCERLRGYVRTAETRKLARIQKAKNVVSNTGYLQPSDGEKQNIRSVAWNSQSGSNPLQPMKPKEFRPTVAEMDLATKDLPRNATRVFRQLQIKLSRNCASCHEKPTDKFQLISVRRGQKADWRTTQKNMYFVFQHMDRKDPDRSQLLKMMKTQHGGQNLPAYPQDSTTFVMMRNWMFYVTGNERLYQQKLLQQKMGITAPNSPNPPEKSEDVPRQKSSAPNIPDPLATKNKGQGSSVMSPQKLTPPSPAQLINSKKPLAKDPFDPAIFNQKHHPNRTQR